MSCNYASYSIHSGNVSSLRFSYDGAYLFSGGFDGSVSFWSPHCNTRINRCRMNDCDIREISIVQDSTKLISVGADKQVSLLDVPTGTVVQKFVGHDRPINSVCLGAHEKVIISGSEDKTVKVWDYSSRITRPVQVLRSFNDSVASVKATYWGHSIFVGSLDGSVKRFDVRRGLEISDMLNCPVTSICPSSDENLVLVSCLDDVLRLLDCQAGASLHHYMGHKNCGIKMECCFTPTESHVVCCSEDGRIYVWDLYEGNLELMIETGMATSLAVNPKEHYIAVGCMDGRIKLCGMPLTSGCNSITVKKTTKVVIDDEMYSKG